MKRHLKWSPVAWGFGHRMSSGIAAISESCRTRHHSA